MLDHQAELYQRIQAFNLDKATASFPFSHRLARENGWTLDFAQQVIEEYKIFAFLAIVVGHPVTPSEQVDQAWHLHLIYTRSYWEEFCPQVLGKPLHHGPTAGGTDEQAKHYNWYEKTLSSYVKWFGMAPPVKIWPPSEQRFGHDLQTVRVNRADYWIVPKLQLPRFAMWRSKITRFGLAAIGCAFTLSSCTIAGTTNPLNWQGGEFLRFYLFAWIVAFVLALIVRSNLTYRARRIDVEAVDLHPYEIAYLANDQPHRAVDAAIAVMINQKHLAVDSSAKTFVAKTPLPSDCHPLEQAILNAANAPIHLNQLYRSVIKPLDQIRDRLIEFNLSPNSNQRWLSRLIPALLFLPVLGLGLSKIAIGVARAKPVGFLIFLCIVTAFVSWLFWLTPSSHRNRNGEKVLARLKSKYARFRAPQAATQTIATDVAIAVGLFGIATLGSEFASFKQIVQPASSSSGGVYGGDSGSDGGGGCGGGCGGCGGG